MRLCWGSTATWMLKPTSVIRPPPMGMEQASGSVREIWDGSLSSVRLSSPFYSTMRSFSSRIFSLSSSLVSLRSLGSWASFASSAFR